MFRIANVKGMMEKLPNREHQPLKKNICRLTRPNANGWKSVLLEHAITPIQQYSYTTGKKTRFSLNY
jgi:hypothetical protein